MTATETDLTNYVEWCTRQTIDTSVHTYLRAQDDMANRTRIQNAVDIVVHAYDIYVHDYEGADLFDAFEQVCHDMRRAADALIDGRDFTVDRVVGGSTHVHIGERKA